MVLPCLSLLLFMCMHGLLMLVCTCIPPLPVVLFPLPAYLLPPPPKQQPNY